ncbi:MAG: transporter [Flavobacteriaceae bacterium]|nr:transporter [Flavobacteriaceae bacterium]
MNEVYKRIFVLILQLFSFITVVNAQDLDPRAYVNIPVNATIVISGLTFSKGDVLLDPSLPIEDLDATVESASLGVSHTFSLFGQTAQALAVLPYSWAQLTGKIDGLERDKNLNGIGDMRFRLSVLLLGGKAISLSDFSKQTNRTILGASISLVAPTGEYDSDKLINLGTNRWSFKPELALSQRMGDRRMLDVYSGVWLFTENDSFYPGKSERKQDPLYSFQTHLSYNINPRMWAAFDATYYVGGQSSVNDEYNDDRQSNARLGATLVFPVAKWNSVKIAYSQGAIIRTGADFKTFSVGWSRTWF